MSLYLCPCPPQPACASTLPLIPTGARDEQVQYPGLRAVQAVPAAVQGAKQDALRRCGKRDSRQKTWTGVLGELHTQGSSAGGAQCAVLGRGGECGEAGFEGTHASDASTAVCHSCCCML